MSRLPTDGSARVNNGLQRPYNGHPIFLLRKASILFASIGSVLGLLSSTSSFGGQWSGASMLFLGLSVFLAFCDLTQWAMKKVEKPHEEPKWPSKAIMVGDVLLSLLLFLLFLGTAASAEYVYGSHVVAAYTALADLVCSAIHAYSFWKELMACCEKRVRAELLLAPCSRCGYMEDSGRQGQNEDRPHAVQPPNTFAYAGPSAGIPEAQPPTENMETALEEGLLIGTDYGSSYGTMDETPDSALEQPPEVMVTKGKKKRAVK